MTLIEERKILFLKLLAEEEARLEEGEKLSIERMLQLLIEFMQETIILTESKKEPPKIILHDHRAIKNLEERRILLQDGTGSANGFFQVQLEESTNML